MFFIRQCRIYIHTNVSQTIGCKTINRNWMMKAKSLKMILVSNEICSWLPPGLDGRKVCSKEHISLITNSYPRGASDARVLAIIVSVCLSVTRWYGIKTAKRRVTQTTPRDSAGTRFLTPRVVGGRPPLGPFPLQFALTMTHPAFENNNFDQYPLIAPQRWELAKKFN